jgi:hypothetical protein
VLLFLDNDVDVIIFLIFSFSPLANSLLDEGKELVKFCLLSERRDLYKANRSDDITTGTKRLRKL